MHERDTEEYLLGLVEVAQILRTRPERVISLTEQFCSSLSDYTAQPTPEFTHSDLATLITVQKLAQSGYQTNGFETNGTDPRDLELDDETSSQNGQSENVESAALFRSAQSNGDSQADEASPSPPHTAETNSNLKEQTQPPIKHPSAVQESSDHGHKVESLSTALPESTSTSSGEVLGDMLTTIATNQQSVLNVQDSLREMLNVIAQDNFNLKHENRKLRERMLEMERVLAEHQRREETRKEMLESRMRAVEGTLSALQQQLAQLVQLQRQRIRRNWFK